MKSLVSSFQIEGINISNANASELLKKVELSLEK